ncbi:MAG: hypothetical protein IKH14_00365 [Prevotella sp.]|nr:hypothetical protein [Prevotella sp.]
MRRWTDDEHHNTFNQGLPQAFRSHRRRAPCRGQGQDPTAWQIEGIQTKSPYAIVDGHRYDLAMHEIFALRKAIAEVG